MMKFLVYMYFKRMLMLVLTGGKIVLQLTDKRLSRISFNNGIVLFDKIEKSGVVYNTLQ